MEQHNQPITLFGVSLKGIITALVFLTILFAALDPLDLKTVITEMVSSNRDQGQDASPPRQQGTIVATPEMISKAADEITAKRISDYEKTDSASPKDRFFYIVELVNGGDIDATDVTIEPEIVTIVSRSGIQTVVSRTAIKNIRRYKLPDVTQP